MDDDDDIDYNYNNDNHALFNSTSDPFASYHLAELTSNLKKLRPKKQYRDSIYGALTLN